MRKDGISQQRQLDVDKYLKKRSAIALREHPYPRYSAAAEQESLFSLKVFKKNSPLFIPVLLGGSMFLLLVLLAVKGGQILNGRMNIGVLGPAALVFIAIGVVLSAALYYAPNDAIWSIAALAGAMCYMAVSGWVIFGFWPTFLFSIGCSVLIIIVIRLMTYPVMENSAHVMVLFGKYYRTLEPGLHIRVPGEHIWAIVPTHDMVLDITMREVVTRDTKQIDFTLHALYHIAPQQANNLLKLNEPWKEYIQATAERICRDLINDYNSTELCDDEAEQFGSVATESISMYMRSKLQYEVGRWGIVVTQTRLTAFAESRRQIISATYSAQQETVDGDMLADLRADVMQPLQTGLAHSMFPLPGAMKSASLLSPEALAEAYNAVRMRRVTNPKVIREIALAFNTAANDSVMNPLLPFNAAEAEINLLQLADNYEKEYNNRMNKSSAS